MEILRVDDALRKALGIASRGGHMVQPWARSEVTNPRRLPVALSYVFEADALPSGDLALALELPATYGIAFNGVPVNVDAESGWWCDRSLRKLPLDPMLLRVGRNELTLELDYAEDFSGLEIMYLLGNFGVKVEGRAARLTVLPTTLGLGDWCEQGLAFYAGHVAYARMIDPKCGAGERVFVSVPDYRGMALRILVDGEEAGIVAWHPQEVEITPWLKDRPVELAIEVIGHRRNSHGPFHHCEKWPAWTGPGEYKYNPDRWSEDYQLVPCGLMHAPCLEVRR
jgi:hypothetical protein